MTKEDAVNILEEIKVIDDSMYQYSEAYMTALDMAIEALREQMKRDMTEDKKVRPCKGGWEYCDGNCSECEKSHATISDHTD